MPIGVAEPAYEMISESLEALSKIQQNHSAIQQRPGIIGSRGTQSGTLGGSLCQYHGLNDRFI